MDEFDANGVLIRRVASDGALDAPWGLVLAPSSFGDFGGALLVGNGPNTLFFAAGINDEESGLFGIS